MKFLTDLRLLLTGIWLGAAVFFIAVAQSAFTVLPERDMAGSMVNRTLMLLNIGGIVVSVLVLLGSFVGTSGVSRVILWGERFLLLVVTAACVVGQFGIGLWMASLRAQIGGPIDDLPTNDPLRVQFHTLHEWSVWVLITGMVAGLLAFFLIANRRPRVRAMAPEPGVYDFSKEFKI
jgi:hypothetical protein